MKVPRAQFARTLAFYRGTLALTVREETSPEVLAMVSRRVHVDLSPITLWLDQVHHYTRALARTAH
jgi:hypothetical protein